MTTGETRRTGRNGASVAVNVDLGATASLRPRHPSHPEEFPLQRDSKDISKAFATACARSRASSLRRTWFT